MTVDTAGWTSRDKIALGSNGVYYCQSLKDQINNKSTEADHKSGEYAKNIKFIDYMEQKYFGLKMSLKDDWSPLEEDFNKWVEYN